MKFQKTSKGYRFDWYHPETGQRFRKVLPAKSQREAKTLFEAFRREQLGISTCEKSAGKTIREAIDNYMIVESKLKRPRSQELDKKALDTFEDVVGGHFFVHQVTDLAIASFRDHCREVRGWRASSVNRVLNTVRHFLNWSKTQGWISRPPKVPKVDGPVRESRPLPADVIRRMYDAAGPTLRLQIHLALRCGLRRAEVASLCWSAVDLNSGRLQVGGVGDFQTKSGESRVVYLSPDLVAALSTHQASSDSEWLFPSSDSNSHMSPHNVSRQWGRLRKKLGLKDIKFHDLRATAATIFAEQGSGDAMVASLLGHKTVAMARKYSNRMHEDRRRDVFHAAHEALPLSVKDNVVQLVGS
jgi:integrase